MASVSFVSFINFRAAPRLRAARLGPPGAPIPADPHARADRALAAAVLLLLAALMLAALWPSSA